MKKQMLPVLLTAALGCLTFVSCGDGTTAEHGAETTSTHRVTTTETTATTSRDTTVRTDDSGLLHDQTTRTTENARNTTETTREGLIDKAESALDDMGDTITSVLTEATREVHNHDLTDNSQ